ncbi:MAG: addiction module toxin, HicA family [Candidatus Omnitrophota bacterium]|jgi:predicted RNA binding protein YcfA (HicA-like mRNA interferase family)|nr:MAG: addiction module toxin, HicA family [Candidatus Omnitrophota bacterium]
MPVKAKELVHVAKRLGFVKNRQKGSHARWIHPDGRATTIPIHGNTDIGGWLFHEILSQLEISEEEFHEILR